METEVLQKLLGKHIISYKVGFLIKSLVMVRVCNPVSITFLDLSSQFSPTFLNYQDPLYEYTEVLHPAPLCMWLFQTPVLY